MLNRYFWSGLGLLSVVGGIAYLTLDRLVMPTITRQSVSVTVPDVMSLNIDDAEEMVGRWGLFSERQILRKPHLPRDVVIDQRPPAGAEVKPGRRIYLTVNTGDTTSVSVPKVLGLSVREAQSRMVVLGLVVPEVLPDTIPSSHANTITRQVPEAGDRVPLGAEVSLWYSTGLGEDLVSVPDVVGQAPSDAQAQLLSLRLRSVILGATPEDEEPRVLDQSPLPGTQVREGFEVRLRVARDDEAQDG